MLKTLPPQERVVVQMQLDTEFPAQLLQLVAAHPGYQEHQLYGWMVAWYAAQGDTQDIKEWVAGSLDWFQQHGHVQREAGGRYTCLPSYVLGGTPQLDGQALLCGHPAAHQLLHSFDVSVRTDLIIETLKNGTRRGVGFDRRLSLTPQQRSALERQGIHCFAVQALTEALPDVRLLRTPEPQEAQPLPVIDGVWQVFQPSYTQGEPWQRLERAPAAGQLARWLPSEDWQGYRDARYYFCLWSRSGVSLAYADVALWQLQLAAEAGHPRKVYWQAATRTLWLPLGLPAMLWQWLALATLTRPQRVDAFYKLHLGTAHLEHIRDITETRFQLHWVDGTPSRS